MFKVENTGTTAWKKVLDEEGVHIANLDELYNGDWSLVFKGTRDRISNTDFTNPSRAINWLWKNRHDIGEPFSLYEDKVKKKPVKELSPQPALEPTTDLFWDYKK